MEKVVVTLIQNNPKYLPFSDFIYNRCDKQERETYLTFEVIQNGEKQYIHAWFENNEGRIGIWKTNISKKAISLICKKMYSLNKKMKRITVEFCTHKIGYAEKNTHYEIPLCGTKEELLQRMNGKHLRQVHSMKRKLTAELGEETIQEYTSNNCPNEIYDFYLRNKNINKGINVQLSMNDYYRKYFVTNIYALTFGNTVVSVILSCEQCETIYLENLTYDNSYGKYSPGKLIYIDYLCKMVEKGKRELYLGGGNYEYKKQFGSIQTETYYCVIPRHSIQTPFLKFKYFIKKLIGRD